MAKQRRTSVRGSYLPVGLMAVTVLGLLGVSAATVAWAIGAFDGTPAAQPIDRTGQLAFPGLVRNVGAFEALTKSDFIDPRTNDLKVVWLPEATARVASRNLSDLVGRVLRRDKQAGMVLTEADFLEKGTRPGLAAGIPEGKFALTVPATDVAGLEQLRSGDRFDLLAALPERHGADQISNSEPAALFGGIKPPSLRVGQLSRRHGVKHLVTDGMLVTLFSGDKRSTTGASSLTVTPPSSRSRTATTPTPVVYAELAIDAEEIGPLTEALSLGTRLTCVLRSGRPKDEKSNGFSTEGLVPVITTAKAVAAFTALSDENLIDEATGQLHHYYFPPERVSGNWITDSTQLSGRVVARHLRRGALITEDDLLPPGTRPGISAGLPAGMAAMSIAKVNVQGFEKLVAGDRFSILTRVPNSVAAGAPTTTWAMLQGGRLSDEDARIAEMVRTGIREIVRDAIYLSDPNDTTVVIGIPESEVAKLAQLLRDESEVFVVASSSRQSKTSGVLGSPQPFRRLVESSSMPANAFRLVSQVGANDDPLLPAEAVSVPVLVRDVPAFREISISDFLDPATGQIRTLLFPREAVDKEWELDIRKLIDRVVVRTLREGRVVKASDLAPSGVPPGPAVALAPGMRGVTVNSAQISGLGAVSPGVSFDLVAARGVEVTSLADDVRQSLSSPDAVREAAKLPGGKVSVSRVVASGVRWLTDLGESTVVVENRTGPVQRQTQTRLLADGSTVTEIVTESPSAFEQRTVREYVLAVPEESVGAVMGLLDVHNPLAVSLRPLSGDYEESEQSESNGASADPPVRAVIQEHLRGTDIRSEVFLTNAPSLRP